MLPVTGHQLLLSNYGPKLHKEVHPYTYSILTFWIDIQLNFIQIYLQ